MDLALDLLEREGLEGFGVGSLAREAGIRPPSLYKHFAGLEDILHALISRGMQALARTFADATIEANVTHDADALTVFAHTYRAQALARPQLYRLMTSRPLNRSLLDPGTEREAMAGLLTLLGETPEHHPRARSAWAWAHGLVSLEIADRFPPGVDLETEWEILTSTLSSWTAARGG